MRTFPFKTCVQCVCFPPPVDNMRKQSLCNRSPKSFVSVAFASTLFIVYILNLTSYFAFYTAFSKMQLTDAYMDLTLNDL